MSAARLEKLTRDWLTKEIARLGQDILEGGVTPDSYEIRKAERRAYMTMLAKLPALVKQATD